MYLWQPLKLLLFSVQSGYEGIQIYFLFSPLVVVLLLIRPREADPD